MTFACADLNNGENIGTDAYMFITLESQYPSSEMSMVFTEIGSLTLLLDVQN